MRPEPDDLDRILLAEDTIVPSSGFAASVMEAVHDARSQPPPLTFPWRRFAMGVVACLVWAAAGIGVWSQADLSLVPALALEHPDEGRQLLLALAAVVLATLGILGVQRTWSRR